MLNMLCWSSKIEACMMSHRQGRAEKVFRHGPRLSNVHTMRFGSTAKVLLKCKLKYYRISECVHGISGPRLDPIHVRSALSETPPSMGILLCVKTIHGREMWHTEGASAFSEASPRAMSCRITTAWRLCRTEMRHAAGSLLSTEAAPGSQQSDLVIVTLDTVTSYLQ